MCGCNDGFWDSTPERLANVCEVGRPGCVPLDRRVAAVRTWLGRRRNGLAPGGHAARSALSSRTSGADSHPVTMDTGRWTVLAISAMSMQSFRYIRWAQ